MTTVAAIKIAQRRAGLDDAAYRELIRRVAGVESSKDATEPQRRAILRAIRAPKTPLQRKMWAVWYQLRPRLPEVENPTAYLLGIARRANPGENIESLDAMTPAQTARAVESLKARFIATFR